MRGIRRQDVIQQARAKAQKLWSFLTRSARLAARATLTRLDCAGDWVSKQGSTAIHPCRRKSRCGPGAGGSVPKPDKANTRAKTSLIGAMEELGSAQALSRRMRRHFSGGRGVLKGTRICMCFLEIQSLVSVVSDSRGTTYSTCARTLSVKFATFAFHHKYKGTSRSSISSCLSAKKLCVRAVSSPTGKSFRSVDLVVFACKFFSRDHRHLTSIYQRNHDCCSSVNIHPMECCLATETR